MLDELHRNDDAITLFVVKQFGRVLYRDEEVASALQGIQKSENPDLRDAAAEALGRLAP